MKRPLISVVTVCFNSAKTLSRTLESVYMQDMTDFEYILIDGNSSDHTLDIAKSSGFSFSHIVSEPDSGIYDAMNKGIRLASGIFILFLNSDDYLLDSSVFTRVYLTHLTLLEPQIIAGSIIICDPRYDFSNQKFSRYWEASSNSCLITALFYKQNPHPALFLPLDSLIELQYSYNSALKISADLQLQLSLYKAGVNTVALPYVFTVMAYGGLSTKGPHSYLKGFIESVQAFNLVFGSGGIIFSLVKLIRKIITLRFRLSTLFLNNR